MTRLRARLAPLRFVLMLLALCAAPVAVWAERNEARVALVVGNAAYENAPSLANPGRDAQAVADKLRGLGFEVLHYNNLDGTGFRVALGEFTEKALSSDIALVFYAGHGIEMAGKNYLIPTDAAMRSEATAQFETISLDQVLSTVREAGKLGMVLLDACRDNPFANSMSRSNGTRAVSRGLALVNTENESGILVSFAAQEGATASDGDAMHSPYTEALLGVIDTPGLEVGRMFRKLRAQVKRSTGGQQIPIESMQLPDEDIYLNQGGVVPVQVETERDTQASAPVTPPTAPITSTPKEDAFVVFLRAVKSGEAAQLERFVRDYPDHDKATDARRLLETYADRDFWGGAKKRDTVEAYREYVLLFGEGEFVSQARARIAALTQPAPETTPAPSISSGQTGGALEMVATRRCAPLTGDYIVRSIRTNDTLFVRSGPGKNNRVVGELPYNALGVVARNCASNKWCAVTFGCIQGYSYGKYLARGSQSAGRSRFQGQYAVSHHPLHEKLNVRAGPGTQYRVVAELPPTATGVRVDDCQVEGSASFRWCHLSWRDLSGWAYGKYLSDARGARPRP